MTNHGSTRSPFSLRSTLVALLLVFPSIATVPAADRVIPPTASEDEPSDESTPENGTPDEPVLEERVTVNAARLPFGGEEDPPAHVTVLDREAIVESGARTLQDLLASQAGVVTYDQVGNGVGTTLDLRGFAGGSGTRVLLDGAPVNDPRNNGVAWYLIPVDGLERVEILRGSASSAVGGGAEAGVIRLSTMRGDERGGSLSLAAGSDGARRVGGRVSQPLGRWDLSLWGSSESDDGFRENAGGDLRRAGAAAGIDLPRGRRLDLSWIDSAADFGTPGALTPQELDDDPDQAPFNRADRADERFRRATLRFEGPLGERFHLGANVFGGDRATEILTTGRAAPLYGGFLLDTDTSDLGSTLQLTHRSSEESAVHSSSVGLEWLQGGTDASGFTTAPEDPGNPDSGALSSSNEIDRATLAIFAQHRWDPSPSWSLVAGARLDRDRVRYDESAPDPVNRGSRTFDEVSLRAGATWRASPRLDLYASYGEGFLPPTVEELFAFPTFGSNPDLDPEVSRTWEAGLRGRWKRVLSLDAALFLVDTRDEIVFDPDSPLGLFGANVNAGATRRRGLEASVRGNPGPRVSWYGSLTLVDAEFREGPSRGNRIPLVPRERYAAGVRLELPVGVTLAADALRVGEQVLDNDESNEQPRLDPYTVVRARLGWRPGLPTPGEPGLEWFAEVRNFFDEEYVTRGIWAFDFSAGANQVFLTPAPPRRYLAGVRLEF